MISHSRDKRFSISLQSQGCVFTRDINKAILISDALETGTVQINSAPARGPDHFPFQVHFCYLDLLKLEKVFETTLCE